MSIDFRSVASNQNPRLERSCLERVGSESFWRSNSGEHRVHAEARSTRLLSGEVNFDDFASVGFWRPRPHLARARSSGLSSRCLPQLARTGPDMLRHCTILDPCRAGWRSMAFFAFSAFAPHSASVQRDGFEPGAGMHHTRPLSSGVTFEDFQTFLSPAPGMRL